jgi:hypothetical protein
VKFHYIKEVPEVTANGMAQVEKLFSKRDSGEQAVQYAIGIKLG